MKYYRDAVYVNMSAILNFIIRYKRENDGSSPTIRMIQQGCGISSTSMVHFYRRKLEELGLIAFDGRSIIVTGGIWSLYLSDGESDGYSPEELKRVIHDIQVIASYLSRCSDQDQLRFFMLKFSDISPLRSAARRRRLTLQENAGQGQVE